MNGTANRSLAESAKRGARYSVLSSAATATLQLAQVAILARILGPSEFAIAALALIAVGLLARFADFGLSSAVVHFQQVADAELSTLYAMNIAIGVALAAAVAISAPMVAHFYGSERLIPVLQVLAAWIVVTAAGGQYRALHQKNLDFRTLAACDIASGAVSLAISIVCALAGLGAMAIAWGALAGTAVGSTIAIARGVRMHVPTLTFQWKQARRLIRFGSYQVAEYALDFLNMQMDSLVLGKLAGMTSLGYYAPVKTFCWKPVSLLNPILTRVSFPVMSRVQNELDRVRHIYLLQVRVIASLSLPAYAFVAVAAKPITLLVFGPQWAQAVPVMRALAVWGALVSIGNPVGSLLMATGRVKRSLYWNVFAACITPLCVLLAAPSGATWVAVTMAGVQLAFFIPGWRALVWPSSRATLGAYCGAIAHPLLPAVLASLPALAINAAVGEYGLQLAASAIVFAATYFVLSWFFNRDVVVLLRQTLPNVDIRRR